MSDIFAGEYIVRVRAINSLDVPSLWAYSSATQLDGIIGAPPAVTTLSATGQVMAITLEWSYPDTANIISQIEIRASLNNDFSASYPLTFAAYPATTFTVNGLGYGTEMWFWARLIDKNGLAGEWMPLSTGAGTYGKSSESASDILEYLQGQISESELAQSLADQITAGSEAAAAVEELTTIVTDLEDGLTANWQVKTEVRADGKVVQAGVGLGASIGADGQTRSEFLVMADTVGFLNTIDGEIHAPFIFDTVNDTAILNAAIIGDATINFAKITDTLQSDDWDWNDGDFIGWRIEKSGDVYFDSGVFKGTLYAENIVGDVANVEFISTTSLITRQTNRGQTLYTQIGEFDIVSAAFERSLIVPGGIRFDDPGGGGAAVWVEVLINDVVAYTMGGSNENSFIDSGYYYSTPGKVSLPANQDINVKMRLKSFLNSSSSSAWFYAYYRPQGVTFLYIKA